MSQVKIVKTWWRNTITAWRVRLLEDPDSGPPNNWQFSPKYPSNQYGMSTGHVWWSIRFANDAGDVHISTKFTDEDRSRYALMISAGDFRRLALWYLWRWAWGEWFGLRRKCFYGDLRRRMNKSRMANPRKA